MCEPSTRGQTLYAKFFLVFARRRFVIVIDAVGLRAVYKRVVCYLMQLQFQQLPMSQRRASIIQ